MKYLKKFEARTTNVSRKIDLIEILSLDLKDMGLSIKVHNGSINYKYNIYGDSSKICLLIEDTNKLLESPIYNTSEINEFEDVLKSHNIKYRSRGGGDDFVIYTFDKHGSMTDSESWKNL